MRYVSTRGQAPDLGFCDTTLQGLASDGGLFVPRIVPALDSFAEKTYAETAFDVIMPYVAHEIPAADLSKMIQAAYAAFDHKDVAPLKKLGPDFYLLELFHGPTLAFKDVALQFLGQVFDYILAKKNETVTIIGATSGDTGSAAIEAFKGKTNANIVILHPHSRVSEVQRRQMTTVTAPNVFNVAVEGSFDDCQDLVKAMFNDAPFRAEMRLSAINSINWARILAQVVYYVFAGVRVQEETGRVPAFVVPTGNFGNIYAGYIAAKMGLPVSRLVAATNKNDILHRFFATGRMKADGVAPSLSPSMDIQISSNFERLLFDIFARQGQAVAETMRHFRDVGPFHIEDPVMDQVRKIFSSGRADDNATLSVIKQIYGATGYILDPHTAVGVGVAESYKHDHPGVPIVTLATAHPAKFPDAVERAIGIRPPLPEHMADLYDRPEQYTVLPADIDKVKTFIKESIRC